jgi:hypothetical protein
MCPTGARSLSAICHNFLNCTVRASFPDYHRAGTKLGDLIPLVDDLRHYNFHCIELLLLWNTAAQLCEAAKNGKSWRQVWPLIEQLENCYRPVESMSNKHFASREHSHGVHTEW